MYVMIIVLLFGQFARLYLQSTKTSEEQFRRIAMRLVSKCLLDLVLYYLMGVFFLAFNMSLNL
jgi:hypothetical protein